MMKPVRESARYRAMVVDDDISMRILVRETLESLDFEVSDIENGEEALTAFLGFQPDIILLDVLMPGIDGFTICSRIRSHEFGRDVPIIMLTGLDDTRSIREAYDAGATDFITKPIRWPVLGHRIQYILRANKAFIDLRNNEDRLLQAQKLARITSWELDLRRNHFAFNDSSLEAVRCSSSESFIASYKKFLITSIHALNTAHNANEIPPCYSIDHELRGDNGKVFHFHTDAIVRYDHDQYVVGMTGTLQDITQRKEYEEQIRILAYYDPLTTLPNRTHFQNRLNFTLSQSHRTKKKTGVLFIDLDNFKGVNDSMGHAVGDALLKIIGERLRQCLRKSDFADAANLALPDRYHISALDWSQDFSTSYDLQDAEMHFLSRLGGDEFVVLLDDVEEALNVGTVARRILDSIAQPAMIEGTELVLTASIGISIYPDDAEDTDTLIKNADIAMYQAKERGKNNFQFFCQSMNALALERMMIVSNLRKAIENSELFLHYQPQIDLKTGQLVGLEALVRWRCPQMGNVSPALFIPIAEDSGQIIAIDTLVLHLACSQIRTWQDSGHSMVRVAVNISGHQLRQKCLPKIIRDILAATGADPCWLEIELTEGVLMDDIEETIHILQQIRTMGVRISLDDFGTGYSSLSYLRRFPIDRLKIDKSFINEVPLDDGCNAITTAIVALARSMNMEVIAEGVENRNQLDFLSNLGCQAFQGYLCSRPVPPLEITQWLTDNRMFITHPD